MNVNRSAPLLAVALTAVLAAGCGSIGLPDILGGDSGGSGGSTSGDVVEVRGTVERVDTGSRLIVVDGDARYNLQNGGGDTLTLHYDSGTEVVFEGRTYDPADLERGDRIVARVDDSGSRLFAEEIEVVYDVTGGVGSVYEDDRYEDDRLVDLRGTVRAVDTFDHTIELERTSYRSGFDTDPGTSDLVTVHYDDDTVVEYQGRLYGPENLERGDVVDVEVVETGSRLIAEEIEVLSNVRADLGRP